MRKLKMIGICTYTQYYPDQARYVAAVFSEKEFAKLIDSTLHFVRGYSNPGCNEEETKLAMENPHKLILSSATVRGQPGETHIMKVCDPAHLADGSGCTGE